MLRRRDQLQSQKSGFLNTLNYLRNLAYQPGQDQKPYAPGLRSNPPNSDSLCLLAHHLEILTH